MESLMILAPLTSVGLVNTSHLVRGIYLHGGLLKPSYVVEAQVRLILDHRYVEHFTRDQLSVGFVHLKMQHVPLRLWAGRKNVKFHKSVNNQCLN